MPYLSVSRPTKYVMRPPFPNHREFFDAVLEERRRSHPHAVRQPGLLRSHLGDDRFLRLQDERRRWIAEHCKRPFWVDTLTEDGKEVGKLYRFADLYEADWFRYRF
ncbi:hypothetical protein [uncultured Bosea sp.]|uniref:hypothetical protein n=1 Tax=uncultured Bosea sp. TaxID=211457 RepID=UPI0025E572C5|nr:hypothetical protein [uncultured Bosea sp.]